MTDYAKVRDAVRMLNLASYPGEAWFVSNAEQDKPICFCRDTPNVGTVYHSLDKVPEILLKYKISAQCRIKAIESYLKEEGGG